MKQYKDKWPVIIVGGKVGSFLGEYLAGGLLVVLGLYSEEVPIGNFTATGMHGGAIFIRCSDEPKNLPPQISVAKTADEDLEKIMPVLFEYMESFNIDPDEFLKGSCFYKLSPNAKNLYEKLYIAN